MSGFFRMPFSAALSALGAAALVTGCASAPPQAGEEPGAEAVLLLATDNYELHLRDGHLFRLADGRAQEVTDYGEMRQLFQREGVPILPKDAAAEGTDVLGWRDQECVRQGRACGIEPSFPARDMVRIRLRVR